MNNGTLTTEFVFAGLGPWAAAAPTDVTITPILDGTTGNALMECSVPGANAG